MNLIPALTNGIPRVRVQQYGWLYKVKVIREGSCQGGQRQRMLSIKPTVSDVRHTNVGRDTHRPRCRNHAATIMLAQSSTARTNILHIISTDPDLTRVRNGTSDTHFTHCCHTARVGKQRRQAQALAITHRLQWQAGQQCRVQLPWVTTNVQPDCIG